MLPCFGIQKSDPSITFPNPKKACLREQIDTLAGLPTYEALETLTGMQ